MAAARGRATSRCSWSHGRYRHEDRLQGEAGRRARDPGGVHRVRLALVPESLPDVPVRPGEPAARPATWTSGRPGRSPRSSGPGTPTPTTARCSSARSSTRSSSAPATTGAAGRPTPTLAMRLPARRAATSGSRSPRPPRAPDVERMQAAARRAGRIVVVGLKKMFFPANEKAKELMLGAGLRPGHPGHAPVSPGRADAGASSPRTSPTASRTASSASSTISATRCRSWSSCWACPRRCTTGAARAAPAAATLRLRLGAVAALALPSGGSHDGGMERTTIVSRPRPAHRGREQHPRQPAPRSPACGDAGYGAAPTYFTGAPGEATAVVGAGVLASASSTTRACSCSATTTR